MDVVITPHALDGTVPAVASKSAAHRLLICAALADGPTDVVCDTTSQDIEATCACLEALGASIVREGNVLHVTPVEGAHAAEAGTAAGHESAPGADAAAGRTPAPASTAAAADTPATGAPDSDPDTFAVLDCGQSGSTLRFLLPVAAALGTPCSIIRHGRLAARPLSPLYEQMAEHGADLSPQTATPLRVAGRLNPGTFHMPGNVSSQYITGLLLAATVMDGDTEVLVEHPVQSAPYIDLTVAALAMFDVAVEVEEVSAPGADGTPVPCTRYAVRADSRPHSPGTCRVEGDWSNAAFWLAASAIAGQTGTNASVEVSGLDRSSTQGDKAILEMLQAFGAQIEQTAAGITPVAAPGSLHGVTLDVRLCPDLVPPIAAVAAFATGTTRITGAERLRLKESDRLETVRAGLAALGAAISLDGDEMVIEGSGGRPLHGGTVDAADDHRIAMMGAVAAAFATGPSTIRGAECTAKSYPRFFDDFAALGGTVEGSPETHHPASPEAHPASPEAHPGPQSTDPRQKEA